MMDMVDRFDTWIQEHWDPDATLASWWCALAEAGWAAPTWPVGHGGLGVDRGTAAALAGALRRRGLPGPPAGLGIMLAAPTLLAHGDGAQHERFLFDIACGRTNWCQLFSEPGAGSDLASLTTRAWRDGDRWIVSGQKVWTSNANLADHGMLLARTGPGPGRAGITWFALDMDQAGIELRPLREMTGRTLFFEVFLDEVVVRDHDAVGGIGNGWAAARTTLANERSGLATGAVGAAPGPKGGALEQRCGDLVGGRRRRRVPTGTSLAMRGRAYDVVRAFVDDRNLAGHATVRTALADLWAMERVADLLHTTAAARDLPSSAVGSIAKLHHSRIVRGARELALRVAGPAGTLAGDDAPLDGALAELACFSPAVSIYGGTDQIQRNILAERALGLPRDV